MKFLNVAVVGCAHGELDRIYESIEKSAEFQGIQVHLALFTGDFQALRDRSELSMMACPPKYASLGSFSQYHGGHKSVLKFPSIFIGGNHESIQHSWQAYHGAYVAPNIYFLGFSGVVCFGPLRIAGISGIHKQYHCTKGYYESLPGPGIKSLYHTRDFETWKLTRFFQIHGKKIDIMLSHDWPNGIERFGDLDFLLHLKPHFREDVEAGRLGSPGHRHLLDHIKPEYWFSSHLHVKYAALYPHQRPEDKNVTSKKAESTQFIALDKCLKHRSYLHFIQIPVPDDVDPSSLVIERDADWIKILQETDLLFPLGEQGDYSFGHFESSSSVEKKDGEEEEKDKPRLIYQDDDIKSNCALDETKRFCEWANLKFRYNTCPSDATL